MKQFFVAVALMFGFAQASLADYPFPDRHPIDFAGRAPNTYAIHGIDVSRYQGHINWPAVRQAGIQFAYLKATEGKDHLDPLYHAHVQGAWRAGVRIGAYHFYHFCSSPEEQAAFFSRVVERSDGWMPPALDLEWVHQGSCKRRPSPAQLQNEVRRFIQIVEQRYGQRPIIYTNHTFFREMGLINIRGMEFWVRSTAAHPSYKYNINKWLLWQYTATGVVPGINGNVDINAFAGTPEQWAEWLGARVVRGIPGQF